MKQGIDIPSVISYRVTDEDRALIGELTKTRKPKNMTGLIRSALRYLRDRDQLDAADVKAVCDHLSKTIGKPSEFQVLRFAFQAARREASKQAKQ